MAKTAKVAADVLYVFTPPAPGEFWPGIPDRDIVAGEDFPGLTDAVKAGWYSEPKQRGTGEAEAAPAEPEPPAEA